MNPQLTERLQEFRCNLYLNCWWPPSALLWKLKQRAMRCDGCGRRGRTKHYSSGIHYIEAHIPDPPTLHFCDTHCAKGNSS